MNTSNIIGKVWLRLTGEPFTESALADQLIHDGGIDVDPLTKEDFIRLIQGSFTGDWKNVAFTSAEMLSSYSVVSTLSSREVAAWCFIALTMGEACRRDAAEWSREFAVLMEGFHNVSGKLEIDEALYILRHTLAEKSTENGHE